MRTRLRAALVLGALALAAAALAAGVDAAAGTTSKAPTLKLRKTGLGSVLVDARGHTVYLFEADRSGRSACYGACAGFWPPLVATGKPIAAAGLKASLLGTSKRKNGVLQVTYAGHPLYRFALDKRTGQTKGEDLSDFGGHWYVVAATGRKIEPGDDSSASKVTTNPGMTTTPGSGYSYGGGY